MEHPMRTIANVLTAIIALLHLYIAWFEIFAWESRGPRIFSSFAPELFSQTTAMAANQGIYNAFLAAGLLWALLIKDQIWKVKVANCFLIFVAVAGVFGAATVSTHIMFVQTVPAVAAMLLYFASKRR
jgi:putative membrane protein